MTCSSPTSTGRPGNPSQSSKRVTSEDQPNWHVDRNDRGGRDGEKGRLWASAKPQVRRDRRQFHCRHISRAGDGPNQGRCPSSGRENFKVQPTSANRRRTGLLG